MSKRTRGSARTQHRRPGARPASSRSASARRPEATLRSQPLVTTSSPSEQQPDEAPAIVSSAQRPAARPAGTRSRAKPGSLLAARAASEYVYVAHDLKRITVIGVLLFGALIALWLLIVVLRVIPLPFY